MPEGTVQWGVAGQFFELETPEVAITRRLFEPWLNDCPQSTLARWRLSRSSDDWVVDELGLFAQLQAALLAVEYASVLCLHRSSETVVLHGSLLTRGSKAILLVGPSNAGKSTLAMALWKSGWCLLSDDVVAFPGGATTAWAGARRCSLRFASREHLGEELWAKVMATPSALMTEKGMSFHAFELEDRPVKVQVRPTHALIVSASEGGMEKLNEADAILDMVRYSNVMQRGSLMRAVADVGPLLQGVDVYRLGRSPLSEMVSAIEGAIKS